MLQKGNLVTGMGGGRRRGGAAAVMYWKSVLINVKIGAGDGGERERLKKGG